ncbi:MAG: D-aminoacyl-tRNA deacylase [Bacteroidaceae bacterium]|nr:D-aminoacyl-tRNA deacylase [Bacteroidaceae bacterium]
MRLVIQRVRHANVKIEGKEVGNIGQGLLILVGIEEADGHEDIDWLCRKVTAMRIFDDADGVMNRSVTDINGQILVVSQFTLMASTRKGNRPSYIRAARPETAIPLYNAFVAQLKQLMGKDIPTGVFGADMQVELVNDGPVTILMDSKDPHNF